MQNQKKIQEKFLYKIWRDQYFSTQLVTSEGKEVQVIDPGSENKETDGPDFRNARIKIGNITFTGDIEIDNFHSDWKSHGHNYNKKYNRVILHVIFQNENNNNSVYSRGGRKIPTIGMGKFIENSMKEEIQKAIQKESNERLNRIPCRLVSEYAEEKFKIDYIKKLGIERYRKKCGVILYRLKELILLKELSLKEPVVRYHLDKIFMNRKFSFEDFQDKAIWEQLFYELVFEALGYTNNKDIMKKLAQSVDIKFLEGFKSREDFLNLLEASLFSVSGLVPDYRDFPNEEVSVYVRQLSENWDKVKNNYDARRFHKSHWHFAKLRPPNFPTIRIAGGARLLQKILQMNLIGDIFLKFKLSKGPGEITKFLRNNIIVKGEGFWEHHFTFDAGSTSTIKYFVGLSRADDIIINVIFPVASVYFEIFGKEDLSEKVFNYFLAFNQKSENKLVNELSASLKLGKDRDKSVIHQGMINLYRNLCSKDKCLDCEIGKKVFN